ncbi:MAG: hypothetical protein ACHQZQ_01420 [SAR324 cluster bacterium]
MSKSILVLEENSIVHGLVASALDLDGITLYHEFNPAKYIDRARALQPDLILFSNADQENNYAILKQLKTQAGLSAVPLVLLANSRDRVSSEQLKGLNVAALVRKPFEASDLQLQVSKHLDLIDLVGSAYEYNRSQAVRDDGMDPLARLDVIDPEVAALMQDSAKAGAPIPELTVPEVDFSSELDVESTGAFFEAGPSARAAQGGLEMLDDGPVEAFSAGAPQPLAGEDVLLDEGDLLAPLGPAAPDQAGASFAGAAIQELGPEDLLDEEAYEEATFAPVGVDQTLASAATSGVSGGPRLDEIEVELSSDDLTFPEAEAPAGQAAALGNAPAPGPAAQAFQSAAPEGGDLPPAVRRMMELRPVFSKTPDAVTVEREPLAEQLGILSEARDLALGEDELYEAAILQAMEQQEPEDLAPLDASDADLLGLSSSDELDLESIEAEADLAPLPVGLQQDGQDLTLGEDEEELILSSLDEEEPPPALSALELTQEELQGLNEVLDMEQPGDRAGVPGGTASMTAPTAATAERETGRTADESGIGAAGAAAAAPEEIGLGEEVDFGKLEPAEMDLQDDLGLDVPVAAPLAPQEGAEAEQTLNAMFQNIQPGVRLPGHFGLELPTDELLEVPVPEPAAELEAGKQAALDRAALEFAPEQALPGSEPSPEPSGLSDDAWALGMAAEPSPAPPGLSDEAWTLGMAAELTTDLPLVETAATAETVETEKSAGAAESAAAEPTAATEAASASASSSGVSDSFEDAFAELKEEIASNPQGERLDDILKLEQLQDEVKRIEFSIPQHEHALARAMPLYAIPEALAGRFAQDRSKARPAAARQERAAGSPAPLDRATEETAEPIRGATVLAAKAPGALQQPGGAVSPAGARADLGLGAGGSLLDEAAKARLGQILDEVISVSVRKAVREEMPRLLERMAQESGPAASA